MMVPRIQLTLIPAKRTTAAHFFVSAAISFSNAPGDDGIAMMPSFARSPDICAEVSAVLISLLSEPIKLLAAPDPVAIVTIKNRRLSPAAERFVEQARALAKALPRGSS